MNSNSSTHKLTEKSLPATPQAVIGNNIVLNIIHSYSFLPSERGQKLPSVPLSTRVQGRKVENQVAVYVSESPSSSERAPILEVVYAKKPPAAHLKTAAAKFDLQRPRTQETGAKGKIRNLTTEEKKAAKGKSAEWKRLLSKPKKVLNATDNIRYGFEYDPSLKADSNNASGSSNALEPNKGTDQSRHPLNINQIITPPQESHQPRRIVNNGKRIASEGALQPANLTAEMKQALGLTEKKQPEIPFSSNRFQGMYHEVVPIHYRQKKEMYEMEKEAKTKKEIELQQRREQARMVSERLRQVHKEKFARVKEFRQLKTERELEEQINKRKEEFCSGETAKPDMGKKVKGVNHALIKAGMASIVKKKGNEIEHRGGRTLFRNEHIRELVSEPLPSKEVQAKERCSPDETLRRKKLIDEHQKKIKLEEIAKQSQLALEERKKIERLQQLENERKKRISSVSQQKKPKKKKKKGKKKTKKREVASVSQHSLEETKEAPEEKKKKGREGKQNNEAEPVHSETKTSNAFLLSAIQNRNEQKEMAKLNHKKSQRVAIAKKAEQIRKEQAHKYGKETGFIAPPQPSSGSLIPAFGSLVPHPVHVPSPINILASSSFSAANHHRMLHSLLNPAGDITAPAAGEEEKQKIRESYRGRMQELHDKIRKIDARKKLSEESKGIAISEVAKSSEFDNRPDLDEARQSAVIYIQKCSRGHLARMKNDKGEEEEDIKEGPRGQSQFPGTILVNPEQSAGVLGNCPQTSEAEHEAEYIFQSMEAIDKDPCEIPEANKVIHAMQIKDAQNCPKKALDGMLEEFKKQPGTPSEKAPLSGGTKKEGTKSHISTIKDFDSENEKDIENDGSQTARRPKSEEGKKNEALDFLRPKTDMRIHNKTSPREHESVPSLTFVKDQQILVQALKETQLQKQLQEKMAKESADMLQKFIEVSKDMQAQYSVEMKGAFEKVCEHIGQLAQRSTAAEAQNQRIASEVAEISHSLHPIQMTPMEKIAGDQMLGSESGDKATSGAKDNKVTPIKFVIINSEEQDSKKTKSKDSLNLPLQMQKEPEETVKDHQLADGDIVGSTMRILKELIDENTKGKTARREEELRREYQEKLAAVDANDNVPLEERAKMKDDIDIWFGNEIRTLELEKKALVVTALQETADKIQTKGSPKKLPDRISDSGFNSLDMMQSQEKEKAGEREKGEELMQEALQLTTRTLENPLKKRSPEHESDEEKNKTEDDANAGSASTHNEGGDQEAKTPNNDIKWMINVDESPIPAPNSEPERNGLNHNGAMRIDENLLLEPKPEQENLQTKPLEPESGVLPSLSTPAFPKGQISPESPPVTDKPPELDNQAKAELITLWLVEKLIEESTSPMFPPRFDSFKPPEKHQHGIIIELRTVEAYVDAVFKVIMENPERFLASLSVPLCRDPLFILGQVQNEDSDYYLNIEPVQTQPVLPVDIYLEIERNRKVDAIEERSDTAANNDDSQLTEWSNIHNKCIFDAINDALDYVRPYGAQGPPLPWSTVTRELTYRNVTVSSIPEVLQKIKEKVLMCAAMNAGASRIPLELDARPLPIMQPMHPGVPVLAPVPERPKTGEKSKLDVYREERLEAMLSGEVNENEPSWVDYELEETQVLLDVGDMILEQLAIECVDILAKKANMGTARVEEI